MCLIKGWHMFLLSLTFTPFYSYSRHATLSKKLSVIQESTDLSGSRGEANFVWKCKSCKVD